MTNLYHATPYDISATGFYFRDLEEYRTKAATHRNAYGDPVEEYEIQFIDGENALLFSALEITQASLAAWFEHFEGLDGHDVVRAVYLAAHVGDPIDTILDRLDDVILFEGTAREYAGEYIDSTGLFDTMPESLRGYFDVDAFARDLELGGDIDVFTIDGVSYVITPV